MATGRTTDLVDISIEFIQLREHTEKRQEKLADPSRSAEHQVYPHMNNRSPKTERRKRQKNI